MININGKEYGLFYSIEAHIAIDNFIIANPAASMTEGVIERAIAMNTAYNKVHKGGNVLKKEELLALPNGIFTMLATAVEEQEKADSVISVETEKPKGKNAKSVGQ